MDELGKNVLKGVSRSFYLSLRLLPAPMREAASLGYLLARASDTLADTAAAPVELRLQCLDSFGRAVAGNGENPQWPDSMLSAIPDPNERLLLRRSGEMLKWLGRLPVAEARLVREVLEIIVSGQTLDLEHFAQADPKSPVSLSDDAALDDYAWRVAGCVGAFWTKLGFLTLGNKFSDAPEAELLELGIAYGKGLQLVNILRDIAADLATGRCYLPVADPQGTEALLACHARWLIRAESWLADGEQYAARLRSPRLRAATVLPALLGYVTLAPLRGSSWENLQTPIKVPRSVVYRSMLRAFFFKKIGPVSSIGPI
jgi:farnesyl-diphosphate farnesyltransferase